MMNKLFIFFVLLPGINAFFGCIAFCGFPGVFEFVYLR